MSTLIPCKHLDHTPGKCGPDIELVDCAPEFPMVRYWRRGSTWTDNGPLKRPNPQNVQFCGKGRGRINEIFACYNGEMHCYDPEGES